MSERGTTTRNGAKHVSGLEVVRQTHAHKGCFYFACCAELGLDYKALWKAHELNTAMEEAVAYALEKIENRREDLNRMERLLREEVS